MTTISQPDIRSLPIPLPSLEEQQRIVDAFDAMDIRLSQETIFAEKMRVLQSGVADDLLTGRVRTTTVVEVLNEQ